jgi:hypothetical protein
MLRAMTDHPDKKYESTLWDSLVWLAHWGAVATASVAVGVVVLWFLGPLSAWRQIPYDPILDSLGRYLFIIVVTAGVYRGACGIASDTPPDKKMWQTRCYLRWIAGSGIAAWIFAAAVPEDRGMERAATFLKMYAALIIVGICGTYAGVKQAALKRENT